MGGNEASTTDLSSYSYGGTAIKDNELRNGTLNVTGDQGFAAGTFTFGSGLTINQTSGQWGIAGSRAVKFIDGATLNYTSTSDIYFGRLANGTSYNGTTQLILDGGIVNASAQLCFTSKATSGNNGKDVVLNFTMSNNSVLTLPTDKELRFGEVERADSKSHKTVKVRAAVANSTITAKQVRVGQGSSYISDTANSFNNITFGSGTVLNVGQVYSYLYPAPTVVFDGAKINWLADTGSSLIGQNDGVTTSIYTIGPNGLVINKDSGYSRTSVSSYASPLSGTGGITKTGAGDITWNSGNIGGSRSNPMTFTGPLVVSNGTWTSSLGYAASAFKANGGTLVLSGALSAANVAFEATDGGTLTLSGATITDASPDLTLAGGGTTDYFTRDGVVATYTLDTLDLGPGATLYLDADATGATDLIDATETNITATAEEPVSIVLVCAEIPEDGTTFSLFETDDAGKFSVAVECNGYSLPCSAEVRDGVLVATKQATLPYWTGAAGDGKMSTAGNWLGNRVPEAGEAPDFSRVTSATEVLADVKDGEDNDVVFSTVVMGAGVVTIDGSLHVAALTNASTLAVSQGASLTVDGDLVAMPVDGAKTKTFLYSNEGTVTVGGRAVGFTRVSGSVVYEYETAGENAQPIRASGVAYDCAGEGQLYFRMQAKDNADTEWVVGAGGFAFSNRRNANYSMFYAQSGAEVTLRSSADWTLANSGKYNTVNGDLYAQSNGSFVLDTSDCVDPAVARTITLNGRLNASSDAADTAFTVKGCGTVRVDTKGSSVDTSFAEQYRHTRIEAGTSLAVTDTATLEMVGGDAKKILGEGTVSFASGTTLSLPNAGSEVATVEGTVLLADGARLSVFSVGAEAAPLSVGALSVPAGTVTLVVNDYEHEELVLPVGTYRIVASAADMDSALASRFATPSVAVPEGCLGAFSVVGNTLVYEVREAAVASVGETLYPTLQAAACACGSTDSERATLLADVSETVKVSAGTTLYLDEGEFAFSGLFSGDGVVNMAAQPAKVAASGTLCADGWTGTFQVAWDPGNARFVFDDFGNANSTVEVIGANGAFNAFPSTQWSDGTAPAIAPAIKLSADWTIASGGGWKETTTTIPKLSGTGDFSPSAGYERTYYLVSIEGYSGTVSGNSAATVKVGNIVFDGTPGFGDCLVKVGANFRNDLSEAQVNGAAASLAVGTVEGLKGIYLARAAAGGAGYMTVAEAIAAAEESGVTSVAVLDGSSAEFAGWAYANNEYLRIVAAVGEVQYTSLAAAIAAAGGGETKTVTLLVATSEDAAIPDGVTVECGALAYTGMLSGSGRIVFTAPPATAPAFTAEGDGKWTGTFVADWEGARATAFDANAYGTADSFIEVTGLAGGYVPKPGAANVVRTVLPTVVVPEDCSMKLDNGYSSGNVVYGTVLSKLTGLGTFTVDSYWCDIAVLEDFDGTLAFNAACSISNIVLTTGGWEPGDLVVKTTAGTRVRDLDATKLNGAAPAAPLFLDAAAAEPGIYMAAAQVYTYGDNPSDPESIAASYASVGDALAAAGSAQYVDVFADMFQAYAMSAGQRLNVRANGNEVSIVGETGTEVSSAVHETYADVTVYTCTGTTGESYMVAADGTEITGSPFSSAMSALQNACQHPTGTNLVVTVLSGDGDDDTATAAGFIVGTDGESRKTYTLYKDRNGGAAFNVLPSTVAKLPAGANPTAIPEGSAISYAQADALGLLSDAGEITNRLAIVSIAFDANDKPVVAVNGSPNAAYLVTYTLQGAADLANPEWTDVVGASNTTGEALTDSGEKADKKFYRVSVAIGNK